MSKRLNRSSPNFVCDKDYGCSKLQKIVSTSLICEILKKSEKNFENQRTFFCYWFIVYKEKMLTDRATVKSSDRGWA